VARKKKDTNEQPPADLAIVQAELIEPARDQATAMLAKIIALDIDVEQNRIWMADVGTAAAKGLAALDEKRTGITQPMLEAKRKVDELFAPAKDSLKMLVDACKERLTDWIREQEAEKARGLLAIEAGSRAPDVLAAAHTTTTMPAGFAPRKLLHVRVIDHHAIPRQFLQLDEMLVLGYARSRGGLECKIPGLEFYEEIDVRRVGGGS
jgi:hypothetical protein